MLNLIRTGKNIFKNCRLNSKSGGGLPHYDPPDMKRIQNKRFFTLHDHFLWFKDSVEQQYHVIIKHNQFRGLSGLLWTMFRNFFLGSVCVVVFVIILKSHAHDTKNYYFATMIGSKGSPMYDNNVNMISKIEKMKKLVAENKGKDFLGRRGADYYHIPGIITSRPDKVTPKEKLLEEICSTSRAGRGTV